MDRKPFERCGVKCSRKPSRANTALASSNKIVAAGLSEIKREENGDEPAYQMGVAIASKSQHDAAAIAGAGRGGEPDLARATLHFVGIAAVVFRQRRQRPTELDHIAVAVVPIFEQRKIILDLLDRRRASRGCCHDFRHTQILARKSRTNSPQASAIPLQPGHRTASKIVLAWRLRRASRRCFVSDSLACGCRLRAPRCRVWDKRKPLRGIFISIRNR